MAKHAGENVAKRVQQGAVHVSSTGWTLLCANGVTNLDQRTHVRIQSKGKVGNTVAVAYVNGVTVDGQTYTFSTTGLPSSVKDTTQFRGTATWVEPVGHAVNVYGRMDNKDGASAENSVKVICTEFA